MLARMIRLLGACYPQLAGEGRRSRSMPGVGLRLIIDEMLPVDAGRRLTSAATMALLAYSATDPQAADVMRSAYTGAHTFFTRAFTEESAIGLYAVISGLQGPLLVGAITAEQAWSIATTAIARATSITRH